ncbi:SpoIIE family protein phosphatase [Nocardioides sp.]|uniref:SpoIIE family protein phosphatase n=1 Tax=Nocardioides sp. TaxID=35761 RepID=UPI002CE7CBBE|nr:SpoIIE family protein phosphatase [Nocardioides sp.]HXH79901.1 SpoIIE family protein phosphatase [Nocardioides sp.]
MATPDATAAFQQALLGDDPAALYDKAPCGYLSTTPDGTIVKVNETFLTWTGFVADELVGQRRLVDLLTPGGRIYHETHLAPMLLVLGQVKEIALEVVTADGARLPVLVNAVLDRSAEGEPRVVRVAVFDATERRRYEQELLLAKRRAEESERHAVQLAKALQQTLIPPTSPTIPGLQVAAAYRPAGAGDEVGGDFYDVFQIADGDWAVVLGDVCGKGVEAGVVTSLVRHTVRSLAVSEASPRDLLGQLNAVLLSEDPDRFCTVALLRLRRDAEGWQVTASSGGHPLPLLLRPGRPPTTFGEPGMIVGAFDPAYFSESTVRLGEGESLFLYTDGVPEARRDGELFGEERLLEALAAPGAPPDLIDRVLDQVLEFQRHHPRDDIALLAICASASP